MRWLTWLVSLPLPWTALALSAVGALAIASRLRYMASFNGVYGSGDANLILTRALFMKNGWWEPPSQLALMHNLFDQPPLIPAVLTAASRVTGLSLAVTPLIVVPIMTTAALIVLTRLVARVYGWPAALGAAALIALLPRLSFDSTEPEKAPFVVSLFIFALAAVYAGARDRRYLPLSGLCIGLAMMAHTTAYLFMPVLVLAYVSLHAGSLRKAWNRQALGALVFPAAALVAYFALARYFRESDVVAGAGSSSGGVLPDFVQVYVDAFWILLKGGFGQSAFQLYIHGIRSQLGTPLFMLAVGGLGLGVWEIIFERRWDRAAFPLWAVVVTTAFALQYPASSHGSRYPSYVTPVYIILAVTFIVSLAERAAAHRPGLVRTIGTATLVGFVSYTSAAYAFAPNPGLRDLYASHEEAAHYIAGHGLLDDGDNMLYMGWPSITYHLLEERPDYRDRLFDFGFSQVPLETFTPEFVREHRIGYYLYDHTGRDYERSSDVVLASLRQGMTLEEVRTFYGRPGSLTTLYRLHERSVWQPSDIAPLFVSNLASPQQSPLVNSALCADASQNVLGWEANGWVTLRPVIASPWPCGVLVVNTGEYGGIRQFIQGGDVPAGTPFTVMAALRPDSIDPAASFILAIYNGSRLIAESRGSLSAGENFVAAEGYVPPITGDLRVVVGTGAGDSGDLVIDSAIMRKGLVRDVIASAPSTRGW